MSEFKIIDRGFTRTTLLVPGWATDHRIFDTLELNTNYLVPVKFSPFGFSKDLAGTLARNGLDKISIVGWSIARSIRSGTLPGPGICRKCRPLAAKL